MALLPGLKFGAATSDRVTVPNSASMQDVMPVTFLIMASPKTLTANKSFYMKGSAAGSSRKWIRIDASSNIGVIVDQTSDTTYGSNSAPLVAGALNFIAVTIDVTATPEVHIYHGLQSKPLSEVTYGTATDGSGGVSTDSGTSAQLFNVFATDGAMPGDGYAIQIVSGVVAFEQMLAWQRDGTNPLLPGVRGAWDLGACGQSVVLDKSGNGNHGAITGAVLSAVPVGAYAGDPPLVRWKRALFAPSGTGSLTATLGAATLSATGALPITGSATVTLGAATVSATGSLPITGALTATLGAATVAGTGSLPITGAATVTLGAATLSATGTIGSFATLAVTLDAATLTATGTLPIVGSATVTLSAATLAGTGALPIVATLTATLGTATLSATGTGSDTGTSAAYMAASLFHVADTDDIYYTADTDPIYFTATEG